MVEKTVHVVFHYGRERSSYEYLDLLLRPLFGVDILFQSTVIGDHIVEADFMITEEQAPLMTELLRYLCNHISLSYWRVHEERGGRRRVMADLLRYSHAALSAIPPYHQYELHSIYEDTDLDGANLAESLIGFLESETPGLYVGILANDSVTPPCCNQEGHYECDYYREYWYTVLVTRAIWEQYKDAVEAKDQEWKAMHGCKKEKKEVQQ